MNVPSLLSNSHPLVLPLASGDRLSRAEFERRYSAMPSNVWAELIEGQVHLTTSVAHTLHGKPHSRLGCWLGLYTVATPFTDCLNRVSLRLDADNEPQPDLMLLLDARCGGVTGVAADGFLEGAPELIAEVAMSSASLELHDKLRAYQCNGVQEYLVWRADDQAVDWFHLVNESYVRLTPDRRGVLRSRLFPGLWLNTQALLKDEGLKVTATLEQGLASKEHAAFVRELKRRARRA